MNKAICGSKESAAPHDELETWKETVLVPTLSRYSSNDIYNGDETALFYKSLPHRTYCFDGDKPAGSAKCKDRLTLLIITNMDGSDQRKLSVIGKSKTSRCLQKKYKMQVKDMSVDWYASKNAWMTGEIHHQIMSKLNNEMRLSNRHILYVCDNASSHQVQEYSHIKFLMLPPQCHFHYAATRPGYHSLSKEEVQEDTLLVLKIIKMPILFSKPSILCKQQT